MAEPCGNDVRITIKTTGRIHWRWKQTTAQQGNKRNMDTSRDRRDHHMTISNFGQKKVAQQAKKTMDFLWVNMQQSDEMRSKWITAALKTTAGFCCYLFFGVVVREDSPESLYVHSRSKPSGHLYTTLETVTGNSHAAANQSVRGAGPHANSHVVGWHQLNMYKLVCFAEKVKTRFNESLVDDYDPSFI